MSFQFTCPSRSTTNECRIYTADLLVSIHVPLAEHDEDEDEPAAEGDVSIHVPLAEHDDVYNVLKVLNGVSIHVPLAEHDP